MNDPGLDQPIDDGAQRVDGNQDPEDASREEEQEGENVFLDPTCELFAHLTTLNYILMTDRQTSLLLLHHFSFDRGYLWANGDRVQRMCPN